MHGNKLQELASSPAEFRNALLIDADTGPALLGEKMDPWQRLDFEALDAGWQRAAGQKIEGGYSRGFLERSRGHSKTADLATMATWALAFARRKLSGIAAAVDKDQPSLLRQSIERLVDLNPWLRKLIRITKYQIHGRKGSTLDIMSSDVATSYGQLPDFVICDELSHWRSSELWDSLFSSAAKRANCMLLIISNAGFQHTWQWPLREAIRSDPCWYFNRLEGPVASWISQAGLAEQERLLPTAAFRRLWLNIWSSGAGDALDPELIQAAITQTGPMTGPEAGYGFVAGLDLGVRKDHSALVVLGCHFPTGRIRLASCQSWAPPRGGEVDLEAVRAATLDARSKFNLAKVCYDPYQAELMAQQLRRYGLQMEAMDFVGKNLNLMATALLGAFNAQNIDLYRAPNLIRDLKRLTIVEKSYGFKLESTRDASGHADSATALAIALPHATRRAMAGYYQQDARVLLIPQAFPEPARHGVQLDRRSSQRSVGIRSGRNGRRFR